MTAPPRLSPERLARLLDDAVGQVTAVPGTLDRIHRGIRRRRWLRRSGAALLSAALLAGGGAAVLAVAPGGGPAGHGGCLIAPGCGAPGGRRAGPVLADEPPAAAGPDRAPGRTGRHHLGHGQRRGHGDRRARPAADRHHRPRRPGQDHRLLPARGGPEHGCHAGHPVHRDVGPGHGALRACDHRLDRRVRDRFPRDLRPGWPGLLHGDLGHLPPGQRLPHADQPGGRAGPAHGGAGPGSGGGFSCPGQDLVVYRYQARGPGAFLATKDTYRWAGAKLVHAAHRQTTIHWTAQSPQLARYQEVSCGSLDPAHGEL